MRIDVAEKEEVVQRCTEAAYLLVESERGKGCKQGLFWSVLSCQGRMNKEMPIRVAQKQKNTQFTCNLL